MPKIFIVEGCQMNYVKYLDLIGYEKQAAIFTGTSVHVPKITFCGY